MSPLFLAAAVALAWEVATRLQARGGSPEWPRLRLPQVGVRPAIFAAIALLGAYGAQLALLDFQSSHDGARAPWFSAFPLHFVDDAYRFGSAHRTISFEALALVALETIALVVIVGAAAPASGSRPVRLVLVATAAGLAIMSLWSPVVSSGDVFGYVGIGMLGAHPFDRPPGFFSGQYVTVFAHYPIRPTIYGPVWLAANWAFVALGATFWLKIFALRFLGLILIAVLAALSAALGAGRAVRWAILLNPMLWLQFVANAHNDLLAVVLAAAGFLALVRKRPRIAVLLVAGAGLVKVTFLAVALTVFAYAGARRRALVYALAAVLLCFAVSAAIGGKPYLNALLFSAHARGQYWDASLTALKLACAAIALGATVAAVTARRFSHVAGWFYPALAPLLFPWYFAWTATYALVARKYVLETLLALPLIAVIADSIYALDDVATGIALALLVAVAIALVRRRLGSAA